MKTKTTISQNERNTSELTVTQADIPPGRFTIFDGRLEELKDVLSNLGGSLSLADCLHVGVPPGGNLNWTIRTAAGEEQVKEFDGVLIGSTTVRRFWATSLGEGGGQRSPDCFCLDYSDPWKAEGIGDPGGRCKDCEYSRFGSDREPPACKVNKLLYVLRPGDWLPWVVTTPPASLKSVQDYLRQLTRDRIPAYSAITALSLERVKNAGGIAYSRIVFNCTGRLSPEEAQKAKAFGQMFTQLSSVQPAAPAADQPLLEGIGPAKPAGAGADDCPF